MQTRINRTTILCLLLAGIVSCGFHLRGQIQISEQALPIYLFDEDSFHQIRKKLVTLFESSSITTTESEQSASSVIRITSESQTNRVISVDSLGRTREYQLISLVEFTLTINQVTVNKSIQVTREIAFDESNILAFKKEEKILFEEMLSEQARLILKQLQAQAKRSR